MSDAATGQPVEVPAESPATPTAPTETTIPVSTGDAGDQMCIRDRVGGISDAEYAFLSNPANNEPLINRAIDGLYTPGSTFTVSYTHLDVYKRQTPVWSRRPSPACGCRGGSR